MVGAEIGDAIREGIRVANMLDVHVKFGFAKGRKYLIQPKDDWLRILQNSNENKFSDIYGEKLFTSEIF